MKFLICSLLIAVPCALASVNLHPLSDEFIAYINSLNSTWIAGRNFDVNTPISYIRRLNGALESNIIGVPRKVYQVLDDIPESFDAREAWPQCASSIGDIRDQGNCGSCWAVAATEAMSDRICIASNGEKQVYVSDQDVLDCCDSCGQGCSGGFTMAAWAYWKNNGIVTGGQYNSTTGCKAYEIRPCAHHIVSDRPPCNETLTSSACVQSCDNSSSLDYQQDLTFGKDYYYVASTAIQIQQEILAFGPVAAAFTVYTDFYTYKSGVYQHVAGDIEGGHVAKILGWGVENDVPYWLVANSWNTDWGDNGYFKILRGEDHCGIESVITAGQPKL